MDEGHNAAESEENVRTLPVVLHSLLVGKQVSASVPPLAASYEQAAWRKLLEVCGGQHSTEEAGLVTPDFALKADEFLRTALEAASAPRGSAHRKHLSKLAAVIHRWRPTGAEYEEEEDTLLNGHVGKKEGYLCGNKSTVKVLCDGAAVTRAGFTRAASPTFPSRKWMTASVAEYVKWHSERVSLLRHRMLAAEGGRSRRHAKSENSSERGIDSPQVVRVGQLGSAEGRAFSFASLVFFDDFSRGSVQLLSAEETLSRQCAAAGGRSSRSEGGAAPPPAEDAVPSCKPDAEGRVKDEFEREEKQATERTDQASVATTVSTDSAEEICLYRGQVVELRGLIKEDEFGVKLIVSSIRGGPPLPSPQYLSQPPLSLTRKSAPGGDLRESTVEEMYQGDPVHIIVASGQMLQSNSPHMRVRLLELELLLTRVRERAPHILILFGPVVPSSGVGEANLSDPEEFHSLPDVRLLYRDFFRLVTQRLCGVRTKVFIVPSSADVGHASPLPQPPYSAQLYAKSFPHSPPEQQQIHFLPNPAFVRVNELELLLTSADPLMEIGSELCYTRNCCGSRQELIKACCESLLRQRTLFPAGTCAGTPVEPTLFPPLMFDATEPRSISVAGRGDDHTSSRNCLVDIRLNARISSDNSASGRPHIIIFPSHANYSPSAKNGGAFACFVSERLVVIPYSPRNIEAADRAEWTSVYINPPRRKHHAFSNVSGAAKEVSGGSEPCSDANTARGTVEDKITWLPIELEKRVTVRHASCHVR